MPPSRLEFPVRLDLSGSVNAQFGITGEQLDQWASQWAHQIATVCRGERGSFYQLPEHHADQYQSLREQSQLGKIFSIANRLHDEIDAVVVLGSDRWTSAAQVLMRACCDPYHNELERARRGSKPRLYFVGERFDNDSIAALLHRLSSNTVDQTLAQSRWALVFVDHDPSILRAFHLLAGRLIAQMQSADRKGWQQRLFVISSELKQTVGHLELASWANQSTHALFELPAKCTPRQSVLTAATLLPAAMLGLDCMKLTEGALQLNRHFVEASIEENLPLRWWAIHRLLEQRGHCDAQWSVESPALIDFPKWHSDPPAETHRAEDGEIDRPAVKGSGKPVINSLTTLSDRQDPCLGAQLDQQRRARLDGNRQAFLRSVCPMVELQLATIDTFHLGYLFQMMLVSDSLSPPT